MARVIAVVRDARLYLFLEYPLLACGDQFKI